MDDTWSEQEGWNIGTYTEGQSSANEVEVLLGNDCPYCRSKNNQRFRKRAG